MNSKKFGCAMLAGGRGKRLGSLNKAQLEYGNKTFADLITKELALTGMPCYLSVAVYDQPLPSGWIIVKDEVTGRDGEFIGPMGGICSCLKQAQKDGLGGLFFVPCDAPLFGKEVVDRMTRILKEDRETDALVWRTRDGRVQTTFGWYSVRCIPVFEEEIRNNGLKLRKSLEHLNCRILETASEDIDDYYFTNINRAEDYEKIMNTTKTKQNSNQKISLEDGIRLLAGHTQKIQEKEKLPFRKALGRTLAEDITATCDQPPFPRSPFDGYAIKSTDSIGADREHPVKLKVIGEVDAGGLFEEPVADGQALRIMTGAPVPDGADAIIKQEDTDYGEETVSIYRQMRSGQNVCAKGEDYCKGEVLLADRTYIGPVETGIIASTGRTEVEVYRRPRVLLLSTGDELTMPGQELGPGKIYDTNLFTLEALLTEWGVEVTEAAQVTDDPVLAADVIRRYVDHVDLIITSGGVSVGKRDIMHDVYNLLGAERTFWKIGIKPGSAMLTGRYKGKQILSLSGNPYAAFVDLQLAVRPVIMAMNGNDHLAMVRGKAILLSGYNKESRVRRFVRAFVQDGKAYTEGHLGGNGDISSGLGINALIEIPAGSGALQEGSEVNILFL